MTKLRAFRDLRGLKLQRTVQKLKYKVFMNSNTIKILILSLLIIFIVPSAHSEVSLERKIGQMIFVGFRGLEINENHSIVKQIQKFHLGGVILYDRDVALDSPIRNIKSPEQLKKLVQDLKKYSLDPLFVAIDQEGGKVVRLKEEYGFGKTVSAQYLGQMNDLDLTAEYSEQIASTLNDMGININFAPVVDLDSNSDNPIISKKSRSFSDDPGVVTGHAQKFIQAHSKHHVISVLKHFPGHGSAGADSHLGFVDVTNLWSEKELIPYQRLIQTGDCSMIMTAHIFNKNLDPNYPATLSRNVIDKILRRQYQFDGVVISDDMQMKAISDHFELKESVERAILAGVDILLFSNNTIYDEKIAEKVFIIIHELVDKKKISMDRINQSYQRIKELKNDQSI